MAFEDIDRFVTGEQVIIENVTSLFSTVQLHSENISSIAEEQAAFSEEMLATIEQQYSIIENLYTGMIDIQKSSERLKGIIQDSIYQ